VIAFENVDPYNDVARFRALLDAVYTPIMAIDTHGRIKVFNKRMAQVLDLDAQMVITIPATDVIENREILDLLKQESIYPDNKITLKENRYIPFSKDIFIEGKYVGRVLVLRDVSEIEQLIRESEYTRRLNRELEAIIASSFDGLSVTDGQANILKVNQGFERIMGVTAEQVVGRNMVDLVREGVFLKSATLAALEKRERVTIALTAKSGNEALVTSNPIFDDKGNIVLVVTNVRDKTEFNMLERKLERVESLQEMYKTELQQLKLQNSRSLVMTSSKMKELINMVIRIAKVDSTVLLQGESGVGKELIAEIIHTNSRYKEGPFVRVNCGAIPENLLESELFGYESGAFTGASKTGKAGLFELAQGGIIFLDEIGELPMKLQVKLLRVLQDRSVLRVGGTSPIKIDCRVIAGTNRDLEEMIENKEFRLDLFYRLNVVPVIVPPLREHREDIPALMNHFINIFNQKYGMEKRIDTGVYNALIEYNWPGNIRELENLMERLVVTCIHDIITVHDLPANIRAGSGLSGEDKPLSTMREALENTERELLIDAFARYSSSYQIARVLGIDQSTVIRKANRYGIKH